MAERLGPRHNQPVSKMSVINLAPETFSKFPLLPPELRTEIWNLTELSSPRVIEVIIRHSRVPIISRVTGLLDVMATVHILSSTPASSPRSGFVPALTVCRESRSLALKANPHCLMTERYPGETGVPKVWFDGRRDTIFMDVETLFYLSQRKETFHPGHENIAVLCTGWREIRKLATPINVEDFDLRRLPCMKPVFRAVLREVRGDKVEVAVMDPQTLDRCRGVLKNVLLTRWRERLNDNFANHRPDKKEMQVLEYRVELEILKRASDWLDLDGC